MTMEGTTVSSPVLSTLATDPPSIIRLPPTPSPTAALSTTTLYLYPTKSPSRQYFGVNAQEVETCVICPDGADAGLDDSSPWASAGDPITCKEIIENAKLFEAGTSRCAIYELKSSSCCPQTSPPQDPCTICPDGATLGDDVALYASEGGGSTTCSELISFYGSLESESGACTLLKEIYMSLCCPTAPENPCVICPDGASAGDDFVPYADEGFLFTCKEIIEATAYYEAGSEQCSFGAHDASYCCPTATAAPENPCSICPKGVTVGDEIVPFTSSLTCMELIAEAKLLDSNSYACKYYEGYEISCCPNVAGNTIAAPVEETSTSATTAAIPDIDGGAATTTAGPVGSSSTTADIPEIDGGAATTTAAPVGTSATTPTIPESSEAASGGVSLSGFGGFAFVFIVSALYAIGFV